MLKKVFSKVHIWLGLPLGILISIICFSGALLVFRSEINELVYPKRYFIEDTREQTEKLPVSEIIRRVQADIKDNTVTGVQIPSDPSRNYIVSLKDGFRASAYVNPYTAEVVEVTEGGQGFFMTMMSLHRWLLDESRVQGKAVVGYTTIAFVLIIISGLILWIPKNRKALKASLRIKTKANLKRFLNDSHISLGFYLAIGLLVLALTGLNYSFPWYRNAFFSVFGAEAPRGGHGGGQRQGDSQKREKQEPVQVNYEAWDKAVATLEQENPRYKTISVRDGVVQLSPKMLVGNARAQDEYRFDTATGEITDVQLYKDQPRSVKLRGWIHTLHIGTWAGLFSKTLTFLVALLGATLPWTGFYMYFTKRSKPKKKVRAKA